jgi:hypothetical protein
MGDRFNPFSRFLGQWSTNRPFNDFVEQWDVLEAIVVAVYREKLSPEAAAADFSRTCSWLREQYPQWAEALRPHWQAAKAGGRPAETDPFLLLLSIQQTAEINGNWKAMQHLPAAREAINRMLLEATD